MVVATYVELIKSVIIFTAQGKTFLASVSTASCKYSTLPHAQCFKSTPSIVGSNQTFQVPKFQAYYIKLGCVNTK